MTDEPELEGPADPDLEAGESMHIHRPRPLHGWRELSLEIGVIVFGIVIAVGLEQTVEFFHHHHQREQLEAALQRDGHANRAYIKDDIGNAQIILRWALGEAAALDRAAPTGPLILHSLPPAVISSPDAGVWPSARASGVSNLLPASAQNWLEYQADVYNETPFKITRLHDSDSRGIAHLILMHSTAGLFGGDALECVIRVEAGSTPSCS